MSRDEPITIEDALDRLTPEDRAWLEERLVEYRDALDYLRDH